MSKHHKPKEEDWMTKRWRPMMAMMYMACCIADFFLFPIMFTIVQFWETQAANDAFRQWVPITLQGGGLFHVAMGAVLGVTAYGRTQEKVAGVTNASTSTTFPIDSATSSLSSTTPISQPTTYNPPVPSTPSYDASPTSVVVVGFGGRAAPPAAPQPLL
jgi:hypothetical protein